MSPLVSWLVGCDTEPPGEFIAIKDYVVTIVPDGGPKPAPKPPAQPSDPLLTSDPWARYFEKARIDDKQSSSGARVTPMVSSSVPKVQQVVTERI